MTTPTENDHVPVEGDALARARVLARQRSALLDAANEITADLAPLIVEAIEAGELSEVAGAKLARVDRMSVRGWRGKRKRSTDGPVDHIPRWNKDAL